MSDATRLRFVVAEDHRQAGPIARLLETMEAGAVYSVSHPNAALEVLAVPDARIDIVVIDLDANGMDAVALVHGIAKCGERPSLIAATAFPPQAAAALEIVARDYGIAWLGTLHKPVARAKLGEVIALRASREATAVPRFLRRPGAR